MLIKLSIRNIVVIKKIDLDFIKGLNVLTGETGAGKSIILQSLQLLSGNRANYQLISPNEKEASVSGFFLLPHQHLCFHVLDELSIGYQYTEPLSLRRVLNSSGTSRCFINDEPVSLNALKLLGQNIINIHGQFDCLLDRSYQQQLLDEMVSKENVLQTKKSYHLWKEKEKELANQLIHLEQSKSKKEYWKQVYDDLATIHLKNGEIENLLNQQNLLKPISHIFHALEQTKKHLHFPNHCIEQLYTACKFLQRIDTKNFDDSNKESEKKSMSVSESGSTHLSWITDLIDLQSVIDQCCEQAQIMSNSLEELLGKLANERYHLNQIDERLYQLRGIAKRYNNTIDGLEQLWEKSQTYQQSVDDQEQFLQDCHEQCDKNKKVFFDWANCLHEERLEKSKTLSQKVQHELTALKLPEAFFTFLVDRGDESSWNERGISEINMMVRTNPKHQLSKLEQIASGGEMSRMLLAIKASLNNFTPHVCLIFDEIDHGVGGDVAMRIGSRLFRLSDQDQVLCITHSPQVAAWADQHLLVEKINAQTMVKTLNESERLEEIARMLSGSITTDDARQAARSLVHDVQKAKNI